MRRKRLLWQIFPAYLSITLMAMLALGLTTLRSLRNFYEDRTADDLQAQAELVKRALQDRFDDPDEANRLCREMGANSGTRITIVMSNGIVLADSNEAPTRMESHADRPEIASAMTGKVGASIRFNDTIDRRMMYVAIPLTRGQKIVGVVRTAVPVTEIDAILAVIRQRVFLWMLAIAFMTAALSLIISRRLTRPLEEIKRGAERFSQGDLDHKVPVPNTEEIGAVARALNRMATQLDERIKAVARVRNEQAAVLSSMIEGVLAFDNDEKLIRINKAARRLLRLGDDELQGRNIHEVIRNDDLKEFVSRAFQSAAPIDGRIVLHGDIERYVLGTGTVLRDAQGRGIGVLVVLNDVTRLRRLENVRREFVANVSHELKTPITSIQGFIETILEGNVDNPEDERRFLAIIARQADRLSTIVEDLLNLSRLEREEESREIALELQPVQPVLENAIQSCQLRASEHNIGIELNCDASLEAPINAPLLEEAVINLIDNAIKYSGTSEPIQVDAEINGNLMIHVRDRGRGIAEDQLPRVFERFYRVDKARSRKLGGSGLGLAIVKHIAGAHGGSVSSDSRPEEGSTFTIHIPIE